MYELDGKTWAVDYRLQPEEGLQEFDLPEPYEVVSKEEVVVTWVRVKP